MTDGNLNISVLVAFLVLAISAYYYLFVLEPQQKIPSKSQEKDTGDVKAKQDAKKTKHQRTKKQYQSQQKKKQQQPKDKPHDPSDHPRYVRRFGGHQRNISCAALSPSGDWMATTCVDGHLRVVRAATDSSGKKASSPSSPAFALSAKVESGSRVCALAWLGDNRTVACVLDVYNSPAEVAQYRIRKKKDAPEGQSGGCSSGSSPYEIVELAKRRFSTDASKYRTVTGCSTDPSSTAFDLILLTGESEVNAHCRVTSAWDGRTGAMLSGAVPITHGGDDARLSKDGKFVCGSRFEKENSCKEVKLYEIIKKRHKGDVDPQFDSLPNKHVMTLLVGKPVADVDFLYDAAIGGVCTRAIVCTTGGVFQVWNIDVEYSRKEDPRMLFESSAASALSKRGIFAIATSTCDDQQGGSNQHQHRMAVAANDSSIHVFEIDLDKEKVTIAHSMERCHGPKGIDDIFFEPTGTILYSKGTLSKDVFAWNVAV